MPGVIKTVLGQQQYMVPPVVYFGGKRHLADEVWLRLGDPKVFAEPFAGMLGVLLNRPPTRHVIAKEVIVDAEAMVCNFWRATKADPDGLTAAALYPATQHEMIARRRACYAWGIDNKRRIINDTEFYDARIAGWWAWGMNNSIAASFSGPPPKDSDALGSKLKVAPTGMHSYSVHESEVGKWLRRLAARLTRVRVYGGDWSEALTPAVLEPDRARVSDAAVFLDPPYKTKNALRGSSNVYVSDHEGRSDDVAAAAYEWAVAHGGKYRVAYCCAENDFPCPDGWEMLRNKFGAGLMGIEKREQYQDVMFFSPLCEKPQELLL